MSSINKFNLPENQISVSAYYVYREEHSYDELCWLLAERESFIELNFQSPPKEMIRKRAEKIYEAHPPYDVLCWLIGERELLIKKKVEGISIEDLLAER
jgi:hypothetical protein